MTPIHNINSSLGKVKIDKQHPYLGLSSFGEENSNFFYGRDNEINNLFSLVKEKQLTVLFSRSGLGKTSLLKAGLFPVLRKNYFLPIFIRLNPLDDEKSLLDQLKFKINEEIQLVDLNSKKLLNQTLWEYFHELKILNGLVIPVLVFDQFEEVFTLGKHHSTQIKNFFLQLGDLIENRIPVSVQQSQNFEDFSFDYHELNFRVIFSLRDDFLAQLERYNTIIPSIKKYRYQLFQFNGKQAVQAIHLPAKSIIEERQALKIVQLLLSEESSLDPILIEKFGNEELAEYEIEPFLLSLICERINRKRFNQDGNIIYTKISDELLQGLSIRKIISTFYEEALSSFSTDVAAFLELQLLDAGGYRKLLSLADALEFKGVDISCINKLVDMRLIRREIIRGKDHIELIHDVLVDEVKKRKNLREENLRKEKYRNSLEIQNQKFKIKLRAIILSILVFTFLMGWLNSHQNELNANKKETRWKSAMLASQSNILFRKAISDATKYLLMVESIRLSKLSGEKFSRLKVYEHISENLEYIKEPEDIFHHRSSIFSSTVSLNNNFLATVGLNEIHIYDLRSDEHIKTISVSPNSKIIPVESQNPYFLYLKNDSTLHLLSLKDIHSEPIKIVSRNIDDFYYNDHVKSIITVSNVNGLNLYDLNGKKKDLKVHEGLYSESLLISPNGRFATYAPLILSTSEFFDFEENEYFLLEHPTYLINPKIKFSDSGNYIVFYSNEDLLVYDLAQKKTLLHLYFDGNIEAIAVSNSGNYLAVTSNKTTWIVTNIKEEFKLIDPIYHKHNVIDIVFSPNEEYLAVSLHEGNSIELYQTTSGDLSHLCLHEGEISHINFKDNLMFTSSMDSLVVSWKLDKFKEKPNINIENNLFRYSPANNLLAITRPYLNTSNNSKQTQEVLVYETDNFNELFFYTKLPRDKKIEFLSINSRPGDYAFLACGYENTFRFFKIINRNERLDIATIESEYGLEDIFVSPSGNFVLGFPKVNGGVIMWDMIDLKIGGTYLTKKYFKEAFVNKEESRLILLAQRSNAIFVMKLNDKNEFKELVHNDIVQSATINSDGSLLVTVTEDNRLNIWDLNKGILLKFIQIEEQLNSKEILFNKEGDIILVIDKNQIFRIYKLNVKKNCFVEELMRLKLASYNGGITFTEDSKSFKFIAETEDSILYNDSIGWTPRNLEKSLCKKLPSSLSIHDWRYFIKDEEYQKTCPTSKLNSKYFQSGKYFAGIGEIEKSKQIYIDLEVKGILNTEDANYEMNYYHSLGITENAIKEANLGNLNNAIKLFEKANKINPQLIPNPEDTAKILFSNYLINKAELFAEEGNIEKSIVNFKKAKANNPNLRLDPEKKCYEILINQLILKAKNKAREEKILEAFQYLNESGAINDRYKINDSLELSKMKDELVKLALKSKLNRAKIKVRIGEIQEAIELYYEVLNNEYVNYSIPASTWNTLCWNGNIWNEALNVKFACDSAVTKATHEELVGFTDSRGLGRALLGDYDGAIEDFSYYIEFGPMYKRPQSRIDKRVEWIKILENDRNPFDEEYLLGLRWE